MKRMEELTLYDPWSDVIFQRDDWLGKGRPTVLHFLTHTDFDRVRVSQAAQVSVTDEPDDPEVTITSTDPSLCHRPMLAEPL